MWKVLVGVWIWLCESYFQSFLELLEFFHNYQVFFISFCIFLEGFLGFSSFLISFYDFFGRFLKNFLKGDL